ncbi:MAG: hypothetical protein CMB77_08150 [Euryarchaeota archaeon]|nr:hypothetical protein [Euryarchaeota archaeon]
MLGSKSCGLNEGGGIFWRSIAIMVEVIDAEDFTVKLRPARQVFTTRFSVKCMAGGTNAYKRFAFGQMVADEFELCFWRCSASNAEE